MRARDVAATVASIVLALTGTQSSIAAAQPDYTGELNGVFLAVSNGQWAQTNLRYHDEATITSTWSFASTCTGVHDCTGRVSSDFGWTGEASYVSGSWRVRHTVQDWQSCADGTTAPGEQLFVFWRDSTNPTRWVGWDKTTGPSGACGINRWLNIQMPFTLTPRGNPSNILRRT